MRSIRYNAIACKDHAIEFISEKITDNVKSATIRLKPYKFNEPCFYHKRTSSILIKCFKPAKYLVLVDIQVKLQNLSEPILPD